MERDERAPDAEEALQSAFNGSQERQDHLAEGAQGEPGLVGEGLGARDFCGAVGVDSLNLALNFVFLAKFWPLF